MKPKKFGKVQIKAYYDLDGEYILFPDNPLHGKTFENVTVTFKTKRHIIGDTSFLLNIIEIEGQEPIECELLGSRKLPDGSLLIEICQDWG